MQVSHGEALVETQRGTRIAVACAAPTAVGSAVTIGIRPEKVGIAPIPRKANSHPARVHARIFKGTHYRIELKLDGGDTVSTTAPSVQQIAEGDAVHIHSDPADWLLFPSSG